MLRKLCSNILHPFLFSTVKVSMKPGTKPLQFPQHFRARGPPVHSQPDSPLTANEIKHFNKYYVVQRTVDKVDLKKGRLEQHLRVTDVSELLQRKIKSQQNLREFLSARGKKMRWQELVFCAQKDIQHGWDLGEDLLDKVMAMMPKMKGFPNSIAETCLRFLIKHEASSQIISQYLEAYLTYQFSLQNPTVDLELLISIPFELITPHRKNISRLAKTTLQNSIEWFCYLTNQQIFREEIRSFDEDLSQHFQSLDTNQKIRILGCFGRLMQKGVFVQLAKDFMVNDLKAENLSDILKFLIPLVNLNEINEQVFSLLEPKLQPFVLTASHTDLVLLLQIAHKACCGSLSFWNLLLNSKMPLGYNELFAILGGYERSLKYNPALFVKMLAADPDMTAMDIDDQNNFLKLMLIYFGNAKAAELEGHPHHVVIAEKIKKKLSKTYKQKYFKIFAMLFLWLLEAHPPKKAEYFKLLYVRPEEKQLMNLVTKQHEPAEEFLHYMKEHYDYFEQNPIRALIEDFIRKRKVQFEGKHRIQ